MIKLLTLAELVALLDAPGRWISAEDADFEEGEYRLHETGKDGRDRALSWVYIDPEGEAAAVLTQSYDNACADPRIWDSALPLTYGPYCSSWCYRDRLAELMRRSGLEEADAAEEDKPPKVPEAAEANWYGREPPNTGNRFHGFFDDSELDEALPYDAGVLEVAPYIRLTDKALDDRLTRLSHRYGVMIGITSIFCYSGLGWFTKADIAADRARFPHMLRQTARGPEFGPDSVDYVSEMAGGASRIACEFILLREWPAGFDRRELWRQWLAVVHAGLAV
jgi:hypothetical protein